MKIPATLLLQTACFTIPSLIQPAVRGTNAFVQPVMCQGSSYMQGGGHGPRLRLSMRPHSFSSRHAAARWMSSTGGGVEEPRDNYVERVTIKWVKDVIVGLRLCPWANSVLVDGGIRVVVSDAEEEDVMIEEIKREMRNLAALPANGPNATTLIVTDKLFDDFFDYNMFVGRIEAEIDRLGVREHVQLATFHPEYQFSGTSKNDPTNWTNKSPFPIFHLLREIEVTKAVEGYGDPDKVWKVKDMPVAKAVAGTEPLTTTSALFHPQRNEKMMRSKGSGEMEQLLARCKEMDERGEQ